jgi:hypothetical protein
MRNQSDNNHNFLWTNSNTNENNIDNIRPRRINPDNLRRMRTTRVSFANAGLTARRLSFGEKNNRPKSPPRAPGVINVSKYEKKLKNLENKNKPKDNGKRDVENKNVASWYNNSLKESKKSDIPKNKRVFLLVDVTKDGKIKHVYDRRFLNGLVKSFENRYNRVREKNDPFFTSPLTRKRFSKADILSYPPTEKSKKMLMRGGDKKTQDSRKRKK